MGGGILYILGRNDEGGDAVKMQPGVYVVTLGNWDNNSFEVISRFDQPNCVFVAAYGAGRIRPRELRPLTAELAEGGYENGWKPSMTLRASRKGYPVLTSNPCARPRYTDEAMAYLLFTVGLGGPYDVNVYTYKRKAVRLFKANPAGSTESVTTNRAVFCFYKNGDVLYIIGGEEGCYWEQYFVYKDGEIILMDREEYEILYPKECNNQSGWISNI